jgi:hypothetical protein
VEENDDQLIKDKTQELEQWELKCTIASLHYKIYVAKRDKNCKLATQFQNDLDKLTGLHLLPTPSTTSSTGASDPKKPSGEVKSRGQPNEKERKT